MTPLQWAPLVAVFLVLTTVAVSLRIWVRTKITKAWGQDDVMLVMAQFAMLAHFGVFFAMCHYYPRHGLDIDERSFEILNTLAFWATFCYAGTQFALKLSMSIFFLTLARLRWQRMIILIPTAMFVVFHLSIGILLTFRCGAPRPVIIMTKRDCVINGFQFYQLLAVNSAFNAVLDWIFAITPIFMVVRARKLDDRARRAVWFLILLAMAGSVVSIVRIPYAKDYQFGPDLWHSFLNLSMISTFETVIATIAISMATMKPLLRPLRQFCQRVRNLSFSGSSWEGRYQTDFDPETGPPLAERQPGTFEIDTRAMHGLGLLPSASVDVDSAWTETGTKYTIETDTTVTLISEENGLPKRKGFASISEVAPVQEEPVALTDMTPNNSPR
ncbi:hypothetical protein CAC42_8036 [Sphaceloma murrayae]|uniref:Rhodopsin domain-containing protein n=1 Tax=Sphaceloma murrayae TaxID=2082308 RepID=A0A2K1QRK9_9PEZI|nr:hypothetical protein CAC42_8036 [Sphaceloma murrayae]